MSRINTNVNALISSRVMNQNNASLNKSLERLSTGLRINRGSDDPAGLIASENLRADKQGITTAIANGERANAIISTAEGALNEVSGMLIKLQDLVGGAASSGGLTQEEIDANQSQVDSIVSTINRISSETSFQGMKLLNGNLDFEATTSGVGINDLTINGAKLGTATSMTGAVKVQTAATRGAQMGAATTAAADVTVEITGSKGSRVFSFGTSATVAQMVATIVAAKDLTGVSAKLSAGLALMSTEYGADQFVQTKALAGAFGTDARTAGTDAVVMINGQQAAVDGYKVSLRADNLNVDFNMSDAFAGAVGVASFRITGGGAKFSLSSSAGSAGQEVIGVQSVASHKLGNVATGFVSEITTGKTNSLSNKPDVAQSIVSAAIKQVATMRGRLGSFQTNTVGSTLNSLQVSLENVTAAESAIRDTDFASETSSMTRSQIMVSAATSVLSMANSAPQSVLTLLRG